jgi:hypothetical protein
MLIGGWSRERNAEVVHPKMKHIGQADLGSSESQRYKKAYRIDD